MIEWQKSNRGVWSYEHDQKLASVWKVPAYGFFWTVEDLATGIFLDGGNYSNAAPSLDDACEKALAIIA